jgi:hypothetical protein
LDFCPWINAYQVECWETLEPPLGKRHDYQVLSMMGYKGAITVLPQLGDVLKDLKSIKWVNVSFRESEISEPSGFFVAEDQASKDNYYNRNIQVPNTNDPSSFQNTFRGAGSLRTLAR